MVANRWYGDNNIGCDLSYRGCAGKDQLLRNIGVPLKHVRKRAGRPLVYDLLSLKTARARSKANHTCTDKNVRRPAITEKAIEFTPHVQGSFAFSAPNLNIAPPVKTKPEMPLSHRWTEGYIADRVEEGEQAEERRDAKEGHLQTEPERLSLPDYNSKA